MVVVKVVENTVSQTIMNYYLKKAHLAGGGQHSRERLYCYQYNIFLICEARNPHPTQDMGHFLISVPSQHNWYNNVAAKFCVDGYIE